MLKTEIELLEVSIRLMREDQRKPIIGITIGDINGVGPEVIIKSLQNTKILDYITPVIYGSTNTISYYRKALNIEEFKYSQVKEERNFFYKKINVVNCWDEAIEIKMGQSTHVAGQAAFKAIARATQDLKDNAIDAVVTAPINKHNIQNENFKFAGHTEYFTHEFGSENSLMLLCSEDIKVALVTGHIPISEVGNTFSKDLLAQKLHILFDTLKYDFGVLKPKVAVLGLNPHAGEEGLLGNEEIELITPVISDFKHKGHLCLGPFSADGFFGTGNYRNYDATLAIYHDQGLIPFKTLSFGSGVNYTAGLDRVRTSPDHGTAYSIAGKGIASEQSMREAIYLAKDIVMRRFENNKN